MKEEVEGRGVRVKVNELSRVKQMRVAVAARGLALMRWEGQVTS